MKSLVINKAINFITKYHEYDNTTLEEIKYGLASIYLTFSKLIIISIIAIILGIFKEMIILMVIYNILRSVSFGLHASKSWICLLSSTIIFIGGTLLCMNFINNKYIVYVISIITIPTIYLYSPADTKKKPIVNPKRRKVYKHLSTSIAIIYYLIALICNNNFIINFLTISLIIQSFVIHPKIYQLFRIPYDNYKHYNMN